MCSIWKIQKESNQQIRVNKDYFLFKVKSVDYCFILSAKIQNLFNKQIQKTKNLI